MATSRAAKRILNQIGDPKSIARELKSFKKAAKVLSSDRPRLIDKYPNRWVVVYDGEVKVDSDTLESALAKAKAMHLPKENFFVRYISKKRKTMIFGSKC
jgi:Family of unknown function (DUF5678)